MFGHEVDRRRIGPVANDAQIALIFPVFIINENEHFSGAGVCDYIFNRGQGRRTVS
jgi:hypothetical protein